MIEVIVLLVLAFMWLVFATVLDFRTKETPNWIPFSLIIFALGFRFFYSLFSNAGFGFFYQGLIWTGIFIIVGNLMYYARTFAGGDAKLFMALGPVITFTASFLTNLELSVLFLFLFLASGAAYSFLMTAYFAIKNHKKFGDHFGKILKSNLMWGIPVTLFGLVLVIIGIIYDVLLICLGAVVFIMPLLYVFTKSVDESCMVKKKPVKELMEGDWLYKDVKIGKETIKANWDGLSKKDIALMKKKLKFVTIREGIAFEVTFLIGFLALIYVYFFNPVLWNLWNSFW